MLRNYCHTRLNLLKAWDNATGPKNTEITRFNAISHGLTAKVAQYHPARPGQYAVCHGCEYLDEICGHGDNKYCLKRTEIYMRHRLAAESGDIDSLKDVYADTQAGAQIILDNMIMAIARTGVEVHEVVTTKNKDGTLEVAQVISKDGQIIPITNLKAHPLIKPLIEMMSKNGITLTDMMLTQKQQGEEATAQGFLQDEHEAREEARERQLRFDNNQAVLLELVQGGDDPLSNVKKLNANE